MRRLPGLYVHLPWCIRKCPYCDFNSHAVRGTPPYDDYTAALCADLEHQAGRFAPSPFGSVFFGGGTPSLFDAPFIERVLDTAARVVGIEADAEITLEANPGAIEHGRFSDYRTAGVNRISLGVQSFATEQLARLGRIHSADEARRAVVAVQEAGFPELNLDLMYALPEQTLDMALTDIDTAIALAPTHLSHYQLTLEPNTMFALRPPKLPNDQASFDMQNECQNRLADNGFTQYEVSAYTRAEPGRHNLNYWTFGDYLGIGAGAHGKISQAGQTHRTHKPKHPKQYLLEPTAITLETSSEDDVLFEFMLNRLRLNSTITTEELNAIDGYAEGQFGAKFDRASSKKLLIQQPDGGWSKTALGTRFLNDLQEIFLP
ncbi:MAG: radical SAM family heme chaperone HemW [Pseudomonadota bacterium]